MKRIIIALGLILSVASAQASEFETKVSYPVLQDFSARFTDAENVNWSRDNGYTIAEFSIEGEKRFAYYDKQNVFTVVAEPLNVSQLTRSRQESLQNDFSDFTITNIYRIDDGESLKYFAVVENTEKKLILTASTRKWNVSKVITK